LFWNANSSDKRQPTVTDNDDLFGDVLLDNDNDIDDVNAAAAVE
jgi:hypothetical protein